MQRGTIGVIGSGNSARALGAYLSSQGYPVWIYARNLERIAAVRRTGQIRAVGMLEGSFPVEEVTDDLERFAAACSTIFVASVTTAYTDIAELLAPYLHADHLLVLFSGKLCGSLEVAEVLRARRARSTAVIETDSLFVCRAQDDYGIWIGGLKSWTLLSAPQRSMTEVLAPRLLRFFPNLERAQNLIQRGLTDFGALAHAVISIANLGSIERRQPLRFYCDGLSSRTVVLLEQMEREFQQVANAYETPLISMAELLNRYYGCRTESLLEAMRSVSPYQNVYAPLELDHRVLQEDTASTLVPLQALAIKAGIATPMIDAVVNIMSVLFGESVVAQGRHLGKLGWARLTRSEIVQWMHS
jgi:opine dehydrogenase